MQILRIKCWLRMTLGLVGGVILGRYPDCGNRVVRLRRREIAAPTLRSALADLKVSAASAGVNYAGAASWNSSPAKDSPEGVCCTHTTREGMGRPSAPQASMRMICPAESAEVVRIRRPRSDRSTARALCPGRELSPFSNSRRAMFAGTRGERRSGPLKTLSIGTSFDGRLLRGVTK